MLFVAAEIIKPAFIFSAGKRESREAFHFGGKKRANESFQAAKQIYYYLWVGLRMERGGEKSLTG